MQMSSMPPTHPILPIPMSISVLHPNRSPPNCSNPANNSSATPVPSFAELRQFLTEHGRPSGIGWFLDTLGFTTLNGGARA